MVDEGKLHAKKDTFGKIPEPLMHDLTATDGAKVQYSHMHWRYGRNGSNFEGQKSIGEALGVSDTTVRNRTNELVARDWLIVVARGYNPKTGRWQTPFYHVFEDQLDCREFRGAYECAEGETLVPKPESRSRVSRKGKGGKADNLPNSGWDGAAPTQVGTAPANPGWHELDSESYPDSVKETDSAPEGAPLVVVVAKTPEELAAERNKAIGAVLKEWWGQALIVERGEPYNKKGYRALAGALVDAGITDQDMKDFMAARRGMPFWKDKGIRLGDAAKDILAWKETRTSTALETEEGAPGGESGTITPERAREFEELAAAKSPEAPFQEGLRIQPGFKEQYDRRMRHG